MNETTGNLPIETVTQYIDEWLAMGVDGIFFDDAGWDFKVARSRLNQAVEYSHRRNLRVIVNAWEPDDVLSDNYHEIYNPDSLSTLLLPEDGYLSESYQISNGNHIEMVLDSLKGKYQRVVSFDQCHGALIYDPKLPVFVNTLHYLGPKYGYWIKVLEDSELVFPMDCGQ